MTQSLLSREELQEGLQKWQTLTACAIDPEMQMKEVALRKMALQSLELRESLDWAMTYGHFEEELDGNPLMKIAYDKAKALSGGKPL